VGIAQLVAHAADESILCVRDGNAAVTKLLWGFLLLLLNGVVFGCLLKCNALVYFEFDNSDCSLYLGCAVFNTRCFIALWKDAYSLMFFCHSVSKIIEKLLTYRGSYVTDIGSPGWSDSWNC